MSKVVSMSTGAIDPINVTKRVFWRPVTTTTVLKVGQPVCYDSDSILDHKRRATDPVHLGLTQSTYAEGNQEFTSRLFVVEEPLSANLHAFAGIVKSLGSLDGADGDMIEIFTPVEGAVVPVYTDENCTFDQTLLGIHNAEADVTYPGKVIGIAKESKDRSGTDGIVWMEFKNFGWNIPNNALLIDDEAGASDVLLNYVKVESSQTAKGLTLQYLKGTLSGIAGGFGGGMVKYRAELDAPADDTCQCLSVGLTIKASGTLKIAGYTYCNGPLHAGIGTSGAPNLSGGCLAGLIITYYVTETGGAPQNAFAIYVDSGDAAYADMDGLLHIFHAGDMGDAAQANTSTQTWSTDDITIPIKIGTTTYYLYASAAAGAA